MYIRKQFFIQFLLVLTCTIGSISDGMQVGWSALLLYILNSDNNSIKVKHSHITWIESCYLIGGLIVLPLGSWLVNSFGRRKAILLANILGLIGWCITASTSSVYLLYFARLLNGACSDSYYVSVTTYISEISDPIYRGGFVLMVYVMLLFGTLLIYVIGPLLPIYGSCLIAISLIVLVLIAVPFLPESPYFLLSQRKEEEARRVLIQLRRSESNVERELNEIKSSMEERDQQRTIRDLFLKKNNRKVVGISVALTAGMSVNNVMLMNVHGILTAAKSIYLDAYYTAIVFCVCILVSSFIGSMLVDKLGRRVLLIVSGVLSGICFLVLAIYFSFNIKHSAWIPIGAVMIFAVVFKFGIGQIPFVVIAELLATEVRAVGLTFAETVYLLQALINIQIYSYLSESYGFHIPFYIFTVLFFGVAFFTYLFVPETKGESLEEIQNHHFNS